MSTKIAPIDNKIESGEFWTSQQRQSHSLHYVISYRAAFKPELPEYFIKRFLRKKKQTVFDPFGGRGTTILQANLDGHFGIHNDINPISLFLGRSKKTIPPIEKMEKLLSGLDLKKIKELDEREEDLLNFYHPETLRELQNLKMLAQGDDSPEMNYICLTALSRLHGHSNGFFSVYTFPQISIPPSAQKKNNLKRNQVPDYREIKPRILKKMKSDLRDPLPPFYHEFSSRNSYTGNPSTSLGDIETEIVDLIVTSPPFLDKVDYKMDNWLKGWFLGLQVSQLGDVSILSDPVLWKNFIQKTLKECHRVMKKGSYLVMEVGDVFHRGRMVNLDEIVIDASVESGLEWFKTIINQQKFTKLSNCWNVSNNVKGTNSNRCVVLYK